MSVERSLYSLPHYEDTQPSDKLRLRKEAKEIIEDPTSKHTHIEVAHLQNVPDVNWDITVSIGPMKTLGGWRIAKSEAIIGALQTNDKKVQGLMTREEIPNDQAAKAGALEAWGLAKEMAFKWSGMRSAMKYAQKFHPEVYPAALDKKTIDAWIEGSKFSGGKSVVVNERPKERDSITGEDRQWLVKEHAVHINDLNWKKAASVNNLKLKTKDLGAHSTAPDMGTNTDDMTEVRKLCPTVACTKPRKDGSGGSGDPSPSTARGVFHGLEAMLEFMNKDGNDVSFAIQGAGGKVGKNLLKDLRQKYPDAVIVISDIDTPDKKEQTNQLAEEFNAYVAEGNEIFQQADFVIPS
jgi:hypothetical protein